MNKIKSVKFWVTMVCLGLVVFIVVANRVDFISLATILTFVPIEYIGMNVWQKNILNKGDK